MPTPFVGARHAAAAVEQQSAARFREAVAPVSAAVERLVAACADDDAALIAACRPRERLSHLSGPPDARRGRTTGRDRLAILQQTLDGFGLVRSKNQREFHREMIKAVIPLLFKDDLDENLDDLLREFEAAELKSEVMIVTPRRWGKAGALRAPPDPPAFF